MRIRCAGIAGLNILGEPQSVRESAHLQAWFACKKVTPLLAGLSLLLLAACGQRDEGELVGRETVTPGDFRFVGRTMPCYLEVRDGDARVIRVNCFHIDGSLHIHSNRFAKLPRLRGESWVATARSEPRVRVEIAGDIYELRAMPIDDSKRRAAILHDRGYSYAWDGITIFRFDSD